MSPSKYDDTNTDGLSAQMHLLILFVRELACLLVAAFCRACRLQRSRPRIPVDPEATTDISVVHERFMLNHRAV